MAHFLSPALAQLRAEINKLWPHRDRTSDGWIGDTSHQARPSDHNPDYSSGGIVRAVDIDEDLVAGLAHVGEAMPLVEQIIRDSRVAYVIYEGRIWQNRSAFSRGGWLPYSGANAHRHHIHVSVRRGAAWDRNAASWGIAAGVSNAGPSFGGSLPSINVGPIAGIDPTEDDMAKHIPVICDKGAKGPDYGSTAVINPITGFRRASVGLGDRADFEAQKTVARIAYGADAVAPDVHVDQAGWEMLRGAYTRA